MLQSNPYMSNNGLRVTGRKSGSISLVWQISPEPTLLNSGSEASELEDDENEDQEETIPMELEEKKRDNNWYHLQMKRGEGSSSWESVYKGYSTRFEVEDLPPDSVMVFRMKRNDEDEWGTEVVASTETSPASVEDLNRAVEMQSDYLVSRILELTRASHLKRILHARDRNGITALMVACQKGNVKIADKLIAIGSDVNAVSNGTLRTPLMFACILGHHIVASFLDQRGANWKIRDKSGCTALDYAINCGHIALVKLAYSRLGSSKLLNSKDLSGWTPLLRATIVNDNLEVLKFLVGKGADINYCGGHDEKSPLMAAVLAKKVDFIKYLLLNGADPLIENSNGVNCLQAARGLQYRVRRGN